MEQSVQRLSLLSAFPTANQETIESIKNPNEEIICAVREALSHCFLPGVYEHDEVEKAEERNPDTEGKDVFARAQKHLNICDTLRKQMGFKPLTNTEKKVLVLHMTKGVYDFRELKYDRKTGEGYWTHPESVAEVLMMIGNITGFKGLVSALKHDHIEDLDASPADLFSKELLTTVLTSEEIEEIENAYKDIFPMIEGLTKLRGGAKDLSILRLLMAAEKDIRVLAIKLADRLHNLRTIEGMSTEKQQSIAIETLKVFYPIAYALGMPEVLQEISGHILKILRENLFNTYEEKCQEQQKNCQNHVTEIQNALLQSNIPHELYFQPPPLCELLEPLFSKWSWKKEDGGAPEEILQNISSENFFEETSFTGSYSLRILVDAEEDIEPAKNALLQKILSAENITAHKRFGVGGYFLRFSTPNASWKIVFNTKKNHELNNRGRLGIFDGETSRKLAYDLRIATETLNFHELVAQKIPIFLPDGERLIVPPDATFLDVFLMSKQNNGIPSAVIIEFPEARTSRKFPLSFPLSLIGGGAKIIEWRAQGEQNMPMWKHICHYPYLAKEKRKDNLSQEEAKTIGKQYVRKICRIFGNENLQVGDERLYLEKLRKKAGIEEELPGDIFERIAREEINEQEDPFALMASIFAKQDKFLIQHRGTNTPGLAHQISQFFTDINLKAISSEEGTNGDATVTLTADFSKDWRKDLEKVQQEKEVVRKRHAQIQEIHQISKGARNPEQIKELRHLLQLQGMSRRKIQIFQRLQRNRIRELMVATLQCAESFPEQQITVHPKKHFFSRK